MKYQVMLMIETTVFFETDGPIDIGEDNLFEDKVEEFRQEHKLESAELSGFEISEVWWT